MKMTRKLIPALAMLLISAVLMGTASFAWFSMNTEVKATGMSIEATTPASLEIATSPTGTWAYAATVTNAVDEMYPVTLYNGKWYVPDSDNKIKEDGSVTEELSDANLADYWVEVNIDYATGEADGKTYALVQDLYLRTNAGASTTAEAIHVKAQATVGNESDLSAGVKVYLLVGGALTLISGAAAGDWEAPLASAGTPLEVTVVVVYDGQNGAIKNDNADGIATSIVVDFTEA